MSDQIKNSETVFGSLAYDFYHTEYCPEEYSSSEAIPERDEAPAAVLAGREAAGTKKHGFLLPAAGLLLAGLILAEGILIRSRLAELSAVNVSLREELSALQEQQELLLVRHASAFSPERLEEYAVNVLGMHYPDAEQRIGMTPAGTAEITPDSSCTQGLS